MKNSFLLFLLSTLLFGFTVNQEPQGYVLDVGHTYVGFDVERFLVGEVSGRFNDFKADNSMEGKDYSTLQIDTKIQVNSLDSNNEVRDGHLKGEMWLYAEKYPEIQFKSTKVKKQKAETYIMQGELTIRGVTQEIEFPIEILGPYKDPTHKNSIGLKADLVIARFDYGIQFNKKLDSGDFFIGNEVKIKIRALAYQQ